MSPTRRLWLLAIMAGAIVVITLYYPDADQLLHRLENTTKDFLWFAAAVVVVVRFLVEQ